MYVVDGVAGAHSLADDKNAFVGGFAQCFIDVADYEFFVFYESVHALTYHTQAFLNGFFKSATNGHHLAYRLHA